MTETQQVLNSGNEEESPEPETSRSWRRRFKASNMSFEEMADILKRDNFDGKYGQYLNPNVRKAKIMTKVVKSLCRNFGVRRSKEQVMFRLWYQNRVISPVTVHSGLSGKIMFCSQDLDLIKEKNKEIEQRLKNMIDVLGRI
ncbi:hypothetical protein AB205_0205050 [Aquarana catesbeiana]|uniref:Uncharacterized protein n=1 Tax=Aquarana catesbeiana TaxID=8400 RepID=A0A2G9R9U7_AQUCT|nr:hypothetical protein AB205_0205050 [Aquarana catesbeiana]